MSLLLDTHALIWWLLEPAKLSSRALSVIEDKRNRVFVSAVSAYEIEYKRSRDDGLYRFPTNLPDSLPLLGLEWLSIEPRDSYEAARFDQTHRDPWDRILAAQAMRRDLLLVTRDEHLIEACRTWNVDTIW